MTDHRFRVGFLFCGSGFGARGFEEARAQLGKHVARFESVGGVDFDVVACRDFKYLSAGNATVADLHVMQPSDLRAAWGDRAPDVVFSSPPCKAFSQLLSKDKARSPEYVAMAELFLRGLFISIETWPNDPPGLLIFENVPAIATRGAHLLEQARAMCRHYGYVIDERVFDCGEIGGLAQRRRRFAFTARLPRKVTQEVHTPPLQRVKACGEVLWPLPLPNDPAAGPMHRIPEVSLLTWLRLAFIPAGGDWRDLAPSAAAYADGRLRSPVREGQTRRDHLPRYDVRRGDQPAHTVAGSGTNGGYGVADPRLVDLPERARRRGDFGVESGDAPASTVRGRSDLQYATASIADPRVAQLPLAHEPHRETFGVVRAGDPAPTVRGRADVRTGRAAIAEERLGQLPLADRSGRHWNKYHVTDERKPALTVTGTDGRVGSGAPCVADSRLATDGDRFNHSLRVTAGFEPAGTITAGGSPNNGAVSVSDSRVAALRLGRVADSAESFAGRPGHFGVDDGAQPSPTVTGGMRVSESNTPASIADPRVARAWREDRPGLMGVTNGSEPAATVSGKAGVTQGNMPAAVADPRPAEHLPLNCRARNGAYGVMGLDETADAVTGSACHDNGRVVVADDMPAPPFPPGYRFLSVDEALDMLARGERLAKGTVPVIPSPHDGYWHRPLTDYELAILQGAPTHINGQPLQLHGTSRAQVREHIGNAVPVDSARAWGSAFLSALLRSALGAFVLSATAIWVKPAREGAEEVSDVA